VSKVEDPQRNSNGDKSDHLPLTMAKNPPRNRAVRRLEKAHRSTAGTLAGALAWIAFQSQPEYVASQIRKKLEGENHAAYRMDFQNRLLDGATGI
jgi:hypothetical protein